MAELFHVTRHVPIIDHATIFNKERERKKKRKETLAPKIKSVCEERRR